MADIRDVGELREMLKKHSVAGYPVQAPVLGRGTVESQHEAVRVLSYKVRADRPVPFDEYAEKMAWSAEQLDLDGWKKAFGGVRTPLIPEGILEHLEAGGTASPMEVNRRFLEDRGCVDAEGRVACDTFWHQNLEIPVEALEKGMLVDYHSPYSGGYGPTDGWAGKIAGFDGDAVLLELFTPTPFMRTPPEISAEQIRKGFYSSKTAVLGHGVIKALELHGRPIPKGTWSRYQDLELDDSMDVDEIEAFCAENEPGEAPCVWQALMLYVIPFVPKTGKFRLVPQDFIDPEYVVEYE